MLEAGVQVCVSALQLGVVSTEVKGGNWQGAGFAGWVPGMPSALTGPWAGAEPILRSCSTGGSEDV